jgi:3-deoxy-alpha-D-manno-octulosonate 8-oxidase
MTNPRTGAKLGMNSDFTVFDQLLLDPELSVTVPRDQYFYTGMDAYIHCTESLRGAHRNVIGDAMSTQALSLCRQVFESEQMMSDVNRANLMVASYLGGCAIATSYVGVVHPFSAGLSVVLGLHHGIANCIALMALSEFYKEERDQFIVFADKQEIDVPKDVCSNLSEDAFESLYKATIVHEKPLTNALGADFQNILTREKVKQIFAQM